MLWSQKNQFKTTYTSHFKNQRVLPMNFSQNTKNKENINLTQNSKNQNLLKSTRDKLLIIEEQENNFEPFKSVCHISYSDPKNKIEGISLLNSKSTGYVKNNSNDYTRSFYTDRILTGEMETETEYRKAYGYRSIK